MDDNDDGDDDDDDNNNGNNNAAAGVGSPMAVDDPLPPEWPRAGAGMYAQLPPEDEGPDGWMVDERDDFAFNHFLLDSHGRQVLPPAEGPPGATQDMIAVA